MSILICKNCTHYRAVNECGHPELLDLVTGLPTDCYTNRSAVEGEQSDPPLPHCGPLGVLYEKASG